MSIKQPLTILTSLIAVGFIVLLAGVGQASAQDGSSGTSTNCIMCHSNPLLKGIFMDGTELSLQVDSDAYHLSVHGPAGLECVACHVLEQEYPHHNGQALTCNECHDSGGGNPDAGPVAIDVVLPYENRREMVLEISEICGTCHEEELAIIDDSQHAEVLGTGNLNAPVCVDCHGGHDVSSPNEPRTAISETCGNCHQAVYSSYISSVHGEALQNDSNLDVPTCTNCHGVHSVRGPRTSGFRNGSIATCGGCHADEKMMGKYDLSTAVFDTYLDDFHGKSVSLFQQGGSTESTQAVCFDCHGIHSIQSVDSPNSSVYPDNLQRTCQQCHSEADIRFPEAWLSHAIPNKEDSPILYYVNLVYKILIPATIGGFMILIGLDANARRRDKRFLMDSSRGNSEEDDEYEF